ncbi:MAG: hypothetical protein LLF95_11200 [Bacteroidales bacterium]|nr:hypothetical protein [Bacteroidales bacterium]
MERKTFVLDNKRTFRRQVKIFVKDGKGVLTERWVPFTTEHLVHKEVRHTNGRSVAAEFTTNDPVVLAALYSNSAYGKDFYEKGDEKGLKKTATLLITEEDVEKMGLKSLFENAGIATFDASKPAAVLKKELELFMELKLGKKQPESAPTPIIFEKKDIGAEIEQQKQDARDFYADQFGKPVPAIVWNDPAFLDGLSNPSFDAEKYIADRTIEAERKEAEVEVPEDNTPTPANEKETLHAEYFAKLGKKVPNMKANDFGWIKAQLEK